MMALNIAVPLATVGDLMDGFGLLSPISPLSVDCRGVMAAAAAAAAAAGTKKQLVSPVGSESSGVSSLDSDEMKKPTSPPTTPTEEVDRPTASSPLPDATLVQDSSSAASSSSSSTRSSLSSTSSDSDSGSSEQLESTEEVVVVAEEPELPPKECKLVLGGRDVLNLMDNLTAPNHFRLQFAQLPENDNIHFFLDNRSQYHRLGANGHIQEYTMVGCNRCDFRYPVNGTSLTSGGPTATMGQSSLAAAFPQQQQPQQQQQQLQWNNLNSIANSRDKMGLNAAANAFTSTNKTFGGGNQYFRNGGGNAMALFGRDSNRGAANFLTATNNSSSTGTYNNHKTYQQQQLQSFNNGKQFSNYQQQQQQPFFSKNQPLRYGQSNGFNAMAAALAANQNLVNFNSFSGKNFSAAASTNNNNNMFAYYKTLM